MARTAKKSNGKLPRHVLVVEDDAILALALEDALTDHGVAEVRVCHTAAAALEELRRKTPDAMVIDVHLADRNDGWAIAELMENVAVKPPQVVFSTGAPQDIPEEVARLGTVLAKPYSPQELIALLTRAPRRGLLARLTR